MLKFFAAENEKISIVFLWVVHVAAMVGIAIGYLDWFASKTPLNLLLGFFLLVCYYPIQRIRQMMLIIVFFALGMVAEWIGVHFGIIFGSYEYGDNLGWKVFEVPILIGVYWAVLVLVTGELARHTTNNYYLRILIGSLLMLLLDIPLEITAPIFDFWNWELGYAPLKNFISWFLLSLAMHTVFQWLKMKGNFRFSLNLYLAQLIFFTFFYLLFHF